jgi:uncharacterized protein (DUF433 family)
VKLLPLFIDRTINLNLIRHKCFPLRTFAKSSAPSALKFTNLPAKKGKHIMVCMLNWADCREVERSDDKVSGSWVFRGTRVPVRALFENLESGATTDQFLEWFPGVTAEQVAAVLEHAEQSLAEV